MEHNVFSDITPDIVRLADLSRQAGINCSPNMKSNVDCVI